LITNRSPISISPAFIACTPSPDSGHEHDRRGVGGLRDFQLALAHADRLDHDAVEACGVEQVAHLRRVHRDTAEAAARRHRANEHARVAGQIRHAHAIAEQRAAAERARRIHGHDRDRALPPAPFLREPRDERALPRAGWAGDAEPAGVGREREAGIEQRGRFRRTVLDDRDRAREGDAIARSRAPQQLGHRLHGHARAHADSCSRQCDDSAGHCASSATSSRRFARSWRTMNARSTGHSG
jgi:hypothetical protein